MPTSKQCAWLGCRLPAAVEVEAVFTAPGVATGFPTRRRFCQGHGDDALKGLGASRDCFNASLKEVDGERLLVS